MSSTGIVLYSLAIILLVISFIKDRKKTGEAVRTFFKSFENIMPQFLAITVTIGIVLALVSEATISRFLGESSGAIGVICASLIGSITMMPNFVAFAMGNSLLGSGAGYPQVGALISTLTMVGLLTFGLESSYIGKKAAFFRNLIAFLFSFVVAVFIESVVRLF
ncbi:MAG: permease [Clostridioides sp.]|jgi:uncharacterized membrane protein YraQ (UPF0718 family)|nr:permease [Clostridioides sp.]